MTKTTASAKKLKTSSSSPRSTAATDDTTSSAGHDNEKSSPHRDHRGHRYEDSVGNHSKLKTPERSGTPNSNAGSDDNASEINSESSKDECRSAIFSLSKMSKKRGGDPVEILTRLFPTQPRPVLEMVIRETHGDVLQAIEQALSIQAANNPTGMPAAQQNGAGSMPLNAGFLQRNPFFSRFYPPMSMDAAMKSAFSPINMMNSAAAMNAAASRMPGFSTDHHQPPMMTFPYLGFRPPGMDFPFQSPGAGGSMNGEVGLLSSKKK